MTTKARGARRATSARVVEHPDVAERHACGRAVRATVPRSAHADVCDEAARPDPAALLAEQDRSRVPELVPIRYGRMLVSPFTFFRGAALVMARDLAMTPTSGLQVQLCGDAHLSNFGAFGTPERRLVFDINDFDETLPGPFEWDVKRLVASLEVAGRDRGFSDGERQGILRAASGAYRNAMRGFARATNLEVFYASLDIDAVIARYRASVPRKVARRARRNAAKARTRDSMQALAKLTRVVDGEPRIIARPPVIVPVTDLLPDDRADGFSEWVQARLREYRGTLQVDHRRLLERYRFVQIARKVVGVGSVGTRAWIALLLGRDAGDPLFLQLKEAQASVLESVLAPSVYRNAGHRVVSGQRLMQAAGDAFLGWLRVPDAPDGGSRDYYVRQLRDWKGSADIEAMVPRSMRIYAKLCGWTLARAHARSGDPVAIAAYLGKGHVFDRALAAFATAYADRNERDFERLREAVRTGRLDPRTAE